MQNNQRRFYLVGNVLLVTILYIFTEFFCSEACFVFYQKPYFDPLLTGFTGILASMILINLFSQAVFASWLRKILSWYLPITFIIVASVDESQGLFPMTSDGRNDTAIIMTGILFLITLIYALIMRRKGAIAPK